MSTQDEVLRNESHSEHANNGEQAKAKAAPVADAEGKPLHQRLPVSSRHGTTSKEVIPPRSKYYESGKFGRMFRGLPAFAPDTPRTRKALFEIGKAGGIMDANDDLSRTPRELIVLEELSKNNPNSKNPGMTAGMTFFGQFIDHDVTLDLTSSLARQVDPEQISNFRTPTLELDNVYGLGPGGSPHLYDRHVDGGQTTFLIEETGTPGKFDLPRNQQKIALIGDPRNDENLIVSQLQLAFLKFHNRVVDYVKDEFGLTDPGQVFAEAQELVRWHYQWIVVNEFLPITCGKALVKDILTNGRKFYRWRNQPFIPVEFSVAAYRFGHSQVRPSYRANFTAGPAEDDNELFLLIFDPAGPGADQTDPDDLSGSARAPRRFIDWPTFFDFGDDLVRPNKRLDTILSSPLFGLPAIVGGVNNPHPIDNPRSLAQRNLLRQLTFSLPSGQRVACAMGIEPQSVPELKEFGLEDRTPLWFYSLWEAANKQDGKHLGPVAGRIVAEVLIGLLQGDSQSYLAQNADWKPCLPTIDPDRTCKDFKIVDLLRFAGVA